MTQLEMDTSNAYYEDCAKLPRKASRRYETAKYK